MKEKWCIWIIGQCSVKSGKIGTLFGALGICMDLFEVNLWIGLCFGVMVAKVA